MGSVETEKLAKSTDHQRGKGNLESVDVKGGRQGNFREAVVNILTSSRDVPRPKDLEISHRVPSRMRKPMVVYSSMEFMQEKRTNFANTMLSDKRLINYKDI